MLEVIRERSGAEPLGVVKTLLYRPELFGRPFSEALDAKAIMVAPRPLVLRSVLEEIVSDTLPPETPVRLDVPRDLAAVADPLVLERVLSNVLLNAAQHGAPPIRLTATQRDRKLRVCVEDEGGGVPDELRERLFERFAHGDSRRGTGLGLAIARTYAQAHGGDLVYHAGRRGACFELIVLQDA